MLEAANGAVAGRREIAEIDGERSTGPQQEWGGHPRLHRRGQLGQPHPEPDPGSRTPWFIRLLGGSEPLPRHVQQHRGGENREGALIEWRGVQQRHDLADDRSGPALAQAHSGGGGRRHPRDHQA